MKMNKKKRKLMMKMNSFRMSIPPLKRRVFTSDKQWVPAARRNSTKSKSTTTTVSKKSVVVVFEAALIVRRRITGRFHLFISLGGSHR